jgi:hypothetical protein
VNLAGFLAVIDSLKERDPTFKKELSTDGKDDDTWQRLTGSGFYVSRLIDRDCARRW